MRFSKSITIATIYLTVCLSLYSRELTNTEVRTVESDARLLLNHYVNGDASAMAEMNHESVFQFTGGRTGFIKILEATMEVFEEFDVSIRDLEFYTPSSVFKCEVEELCFIPLSYVIDYGEYQAKTKGFFIAVLNPNSGSWKYIEGRGLKNNEGILRVLFPSLPEGIEMPEVKDEYL